MADSATVHQVRVQTESHVPYPALSFALSLHLTDASQLLFAQQDFEYVRDLLLIPSVSHKVDFKTLAVKLTDTIYSLQSVFWPEHNFNDRVGKYKKQQV